MCNLTGVILAGGKNSRINREKSLLMINQKRLLEHVLDIINPLFKKIIIISSKKDLILEFSDYDFYSDLFPGSGPLGGIHSALKNSKSDGVFIFACDMPNLNAQLIKRQIDLYDGVSDIVIPSHHIGIEPLHAIYSNRCLPFIEAQLREKRYSVRGFFDQVNIKYFPAKPDEVHYFYNINTHHDLTKFMDKMSK